MSSVASAFATWWEHLFPRAAAILVPALLSWFIVEVAGQLTFGKPYYYAKFQYAYASRDSYVNVEPGLWSYRPGAIVDETVVYKKPFGPYFIESSCRYDIDDIGFSGNDRGVRDYDMLLLGASFAAGTGGCPWTQDLRQRLPQVKIYNAGIPGTGIVNWSAAESYLLARGFRFRHVFLLIASGDFLRLRANISDEDIACLHDIDKCSPENYSYPLLPGMDLIKTSKMRNDKGIGKEIAYFWRRHLWVSYFLVQTIGNWLRHEPLRIDESAIRAFDHILATGPQIHLVRVPTKDEAALRTKNMSSRVTDRFLESRSLGYDSCEIEYRDFLEFDPHPRHRGYVQLAECIAQIAARAGIAGNALPPSR